MDRASGLRLLHFADVHVGCGMQRDGNLSAFRAFMTQAAKLDVDAAVIAGDLFETNEVNPEISCEVADLLLRGFPNTIILPGNHDYWCADSVFTRPEFQSSSRLHVLSDPAGSSVYLPKIATGFHGAAIELNQVEVLAPPTLPSSDHPGRQILIHHGEIGPATDATSLGWTYIALGHRPLYEVAWTSPPAAYVGDLVNAPLGIVSAILVTVPPAGDAEIQRLIWSAH